MTLRPFFVAYAAAAVTMLICDALWLGTMQGRLYKPAIGHLMAEQVVVPAALAFYALYLLGVVVLAVRPGADPADRWADALWRGLLLGVVAYGTYDLTNQATLRDWPLHVTLIDLVWGGLLTASTAALAHRVSMGR